MGNVSWWEIVKVGLFVAVFSGLGTFGCLVVMAAVRMALGNSTRTKTK